MVEDCHINYISQKLETLPLVDYFFLKTSTEINIDKKDISHVKSSGVKLPKTTWSFDYKKNFMEDDENKDYFEKSKQTTRNIIKTTCESDQRRHINDINGKDPTAKQNSNVVNLTDDKERYLNEKNNPGKNVSETEKQNLRKTKIMSPVYSETLPTNSVKKSPNKRKRSSEEYFSYGDSTFSKSCDLEVSRICKKEFCDIQRTLSFDEELLRCDEEITLFTQRCTSRRNRPSVRLTCKSQPSSLEGFQNVLPRARKIKVIQIRGEKDNIEERRLKTDRTKTSLTSYCTNKDEHIFQPITFTADLKI